MAASEPVELRPAARAALRRARWQAVAMAVGGLVLAVGMVVLVVLLIRKVDDEGQGTPALGPGPLVVVATGGSLAWQGLVVIPQDLRALRTEGRRVELRPVFSTQVRRARLFSTYEQQLAWLVTTGAGADHELAIPVEPKFAERAVGGTAALVRGRFEPGRRVVLDFPQEVVFPTGRVELVPAGLPERAGVTRVRAIGRPPGRFTVVWRLVLGIGLVVLSLGAFFGDVERDGEECAATPWEALTGTPSTDCTGDAWLQLLGGTACVGAGAYLVWRGVQRRRRRRRHTAIGFTAARADR